jgi:hypothetical protein
MNKYTCMRMSFTFDRMINWSQFWRSHLESKIFRSIDPFGFAKTHTCLIPSAGGILNASSWKHFHFPMLGIFLFPCASIWYDNQKSRLGSTTEFIGAPQSSYETKIWNLQRIHLRQGWSMLFTHSEGSDFTITNNNLLIVSQEVRY